MMQAISATYDGEKFVLEENVNLTTGQKAIVKILNEEIEYPQKNMNEEERKVQIAEMWEYAGEEVDKQIMETAKAISS